MKILFVDCETTGLDPVKDRIVEIGASLYCGDEERVLRSTCFITNDDTVQISPEISAINKVSNKMLTDYGVDFKSVFYLLRDNFVGKCDYLAAHNAPFDKSFIEMELIRAEQPLWTKPWIDTASDLPFPASIQTRKLTHLAAEHNFLNPFAHTAMGDVLTMLTIFGKYPLDKILKRQASENLIIQADVDYANRAKASSRGYRWNPAKKRWLKKIKADELDFEKANADFAIQVEKDG